MGSCITSDDMVVSKDEEDEVKKEMEAVSELPKLGAEFKKHSKAAFEGLILRQRF